MTALEAMACGVPVVASKFGGIRDVIRSQENGLLIDPTNPAEFANAIVTLLEDRERAKEMGQTGRGVILNRFSCEAIARRHIAFYGKFMKR